MRVKGVEVEDFVNYKKPSLFISMGTCDFKCVSSNKNICQNSELAHAPEKDISNEQLLNWYLDNPITEAIVIGGMEPVTYWDELLGFIKYVREKTSDDIVIYTGYYPYEITDKLLDLSYYENIIIKFGRFTIDSEKKFDKVLGIELASYNQYALRLNQGTQETIQALIDNDGYCPCMIKHLPETMCSCVAFSKQDSGNCHCGIFNKDE